MAGKYMELIGLSIKEFDEMLQLENKKREIMVQPARLIPARKKLDELGLASVFLSSLTLVKEFKDLFCKEINLSRVGYLRAYTEVSFPSSRVFVDDNEKKGPLRADGLLLQVSGGRIKDAALFEMKMGSNEVKQNQIKAYMNIAREMKIPRLVSISNQFVPTPSCYPIEVPRVNSVSLYHFSWRYIIALGSVLLTDNDLNINDPDQINIMKEVMSFFRHPNTGINTFDSMSREWSETVEGVRARKEFQKESPCLAAAVQDWIQEEQDLALKMSDNLGLMVDCNKKQFKAMQERMEAEKKSILQNGSLESQFKIRGAVSNLTVQANLGTRRVICSVDVTVPQDKKQSSTRLNWLKKQMENCRSKNEKTFHSLEHCLWYNPLVKGRKSNPKELYSQFDKLLEETRKCEIKSVRISLEEDLAGKFTQSKKFIEEYEKLVMSFYSVIVQNLKNWEEPPPQMDVKEVMSDNAPSAFQEEPAI